jgi:hypothetical protein
MNLRRAEGASVADDRFHAAAPEDRAIELATFHSFGAGCRLANV